MPKKHCLILLCLIYLFSSPIHAKIIQINNLNTLKYHLKILDKNDLVIFDIDEVIIQPIDRIFHPHNKTVLRKHYSDLQNRVSSEQMQQLLSIINLQQKIKLIDPEIINVFTMLHKNSIPTIALTHSGTGKFGNIEDVTEWRISQLSNVGVSFANLTQHQDKIFHGLTGKHGTALFKSGILFTGHVDKGQVLKEFLRTIKLTPKKVIFIDDKVENLQSVAMILQDLDIEFIGFEYTAVVNQNLIEAGQMQTSQQFLNLEHDLRWTSDLEAYGITYPAI